MTIKQTIRECKIFSALSDAEIEMMAGLSIENQYDAGTTIFQTGESAIELLVIEEGKIALQMVLPKAPTETARKMTVDIASPGELVGWSAVVEPYNYMLSAVCLQKVRAVSISGNKLRKLLEENHEIGFKIWKELIKVVASRLDETRHLLISERLLAPQMERVNS